MRSADAATRYFPQLDGLRAVAVAVVVISHTEAPYTRGGAFGVDVFFVLSGYLITSLLVSEARSTGSVDLRHFYGRRWRRLAPALFAMLAVVLPLFYVVRPVLWRESILGGLTVYAAAYVRGLGLSGLGWMGHLWSLSVEEVFYLAFPLLVWTAARRSAVERTVLVATAVAVLYRIIAGRVGVSEAWLYHAPDMRAEQLLIGASLSILLKRGLRVPTWAGWLGAIALAAYFLNIHPPERWGSTTIVAVAAAAVIGGLTNETWIASRLLAHRLFVWIGLRSYAIYLWHRPLFGILGFKGSPMPYRIVARVVAFGLTMLAAHLSYQWLERRAMSRARVAELGRT